MSDRVFYEFYCRDNDVLMFVCSNTSFEAHNKVNMYLLNQKIFHEKHIEYNGTARLMEEPAGDVLMI